MYIHIIWSRGRTDSSLVKDTDNPPLGQFSIRQGDGKPVGICKCRLKNGLGEKLVISCNAGRLIYTCPHVDVWLRIACYGAIDLYGQAAITNCRRCNGRYADILDTPHTISRNGKLLIEKDTVYGSCCGTVLSG